jgi:hypothetical protein
LRRIAPAHDIPENPFVIKASANARELCTYMHPSLTTAQYRRTGNRAAAQVAGRATDGAGLSYWLAAWKSARCKIGRERRKEGISRGQGRRLGEVAAP